MCRVFTSSEHSTRDQLQAVITADILIQTHGSALGNLQFMKRVGLVCICTIIWGSIFRTVTFTHPSGPAAPCIRWRRPGSRV